jgi:hypothetical protein
MRVKKISKGSARHYVWGERCDGWHLVKQPELGVILERMPPGTAEAHHLHHKARQYFHMRNLSNADIEFLVSSHPHAHGDREVMEGRK